MDQDYIRSRYAGQAAPPPEAPVTPAATPAPPVQPAEESGIHLPHFGGTTDSGEPWYEGRRGMIAFAIALGPIVGIFVWWVITRYDLEYRTKLIATGLSVFLALVVALLL
jgi:hypothetical protein